MARRSGLRWLIAMAKTETGLSPFEWDAKNSEVAVLLGQGYSYDEVTQEVAVSKRTIVRWMKEPDFAAEVDRLTLISDISNRAYRLRMAMRIVRQKSNKSQRDLLEWLKFAQSETDGSKVDFAALFANLAGDASAADGDDSGEAEEATPSTNPG